MANAPVAARAATKVKIAEANRTHRRMSAHAISRL